MEQALPNLPDLPIGAATALAPAAPVTYTVTFLPNGADGGSMGTQVSSVATALTANGFSRTDFTFTGWNTDPGGFGTPYADGAEYSFGADMTLYAQWVAVVHTVAFDSNNGTGGSMGTQVSSVATALTANGFSRTDFTFTGWNTEPGGFGTPYADGAEYSFGADMTLYAQWTPE